MIAPEWGQGLVLSWSGKWHYPRYLLVAGGKRQVRTLCGADGYVRDHVPNHTKVTKIASGEKSAPMCKLCRRSQVLIESVSTDD